MRNILLGIAAVVGVALCAILILASFQDAHYRVQRNIAISAPDSVIFPHINRLRNWERWSPWQQNDPTIKNVYSGADAGTTAKMAWTSENSGVGNLVITSSTPASVINYTLTFEDMEQSSTGGFTFVPNGSQTEVSWVMEGENGFMGKIFWMLFNVDDMIGKDFERGLGNLKRVVEGH